MGIEFKDGAVCFADGQQWFVNSTNDRKKYQLKNFNGRIFYSFYGVINFAKNFQLNAIKQGDYIEASELDTEQKYNDAIEVFGLFGFVFKAGAVDEYRNFDDAESLTCCDDGLWQTSTDRWNKRKLTYQQIMAIGELRRLDIEKSAPKIAPDLTPDLVQNPSHYQFFEGVEVIEIIASSMTREQFKGYCLGNRIKYRLRAGNKDKLEQEIAKSDKYVELYDEHKHLCKK